MKKWNIWKRCSILKKQSHPTKINCSLLQSSEKYLHAEVTVAMYTRMQELIGGVTVGGSGVCVHTHRPAVNLDCHFLRCPLSGFLRPNLSPAWSLRSRLGWLVSKHQGAVCLHLPDIDLFMWVLGSKLRPSCVGSTRLAN